MKTAYIVVGVTGEYEDRSEWYVRVFTGKLGKKRACHLVEKLNTWCKANGFVEGAVRPWNRTIKPVEDPSFHADHTGVIYAVVEAPLN